MNKEWFTSNELAGLPGLPTTDRNVRSRAIKENWKTRKREKGKGNEYHILALPLETRSYLQQLAVSQLVSTDRATQQGVIDAAALDEIDKQDNAKSQKRRIESAIKLNALPEKQQSKAAAKSFLLGQMSSFAKPFKVGGQLVVGEKEFIKAYNSGEVKVADWIRASVKKLSYSSVKRWQQQLSNEGVSRLGGNYEANKRAGAIEQQPEMQNYLVALITKKPHLSKKPHVLHRMLVEKSEDFPHWLVPASSSSVGRWRDKWMDNNIALFTRLTDPDGYNNKHRPLYGKMYPWVASPNDCWEFDSTPTDVQLNVNGKLVRYSIIAAIDVFTRRVKVLLAPTSSSEGICLLLRKCLLEWGSLNPGGLARTDNGSDYVSKRVTTIFSMLDLEQSRANAFSGWEKPFIERFFGTMSRALFELLPGYIGHNVSDRQQIEAVKSFAQRIGGGKKKAEQEAVELALSPQELEDIMNDWIEHKYNHAPHDGLKGDTPFNTYMSSGYKPRKLSDSHCLDQLLNFVGEGKVIRGGVKANTIRYTAPELMNPEWDRKTVRIFLDPTDVGRATLYPLDSVGNYIEAVNDELVGKGVAPEAFRESRKQANKEITRFRKSAERLQEEFGVDTEYARILASAQQKNKVKSLNLPSVEISNSVLGALAKADKHKADTERSDQELERLEIARQKLLGQELEVKEQKGLIVRNIHEKAKMLAHESLERKLTDKEEAFLTKYKKDNPFTRKAIEKIMAQSRQA